MSRSTGDKNSQQQPQQHNQNQNIIQPIQQSLQNLRTPPTTQQQPQQQRQIITLPSSGPFIIINNNSSLNANEGILRAPVNTIPNSICYSTPPTGAPALVINQNPANVSSVASQSTPTTHLESLSPIAKKRLKLELGDSSSSCGSTNTIEDLVALKSKILEHKLQRSKGLKEK
jgi:hypothetical protein